MKKIFLAVLAIVGVCNTTSAQYTPQKNDISVEVGFNPFKGGDGVFKLDEDFQFKARWMFTDKDALRFKLGLGIDNDSWTTEYTDGARYADDNTKDHFLSGSTETKNKRTALSFNVGYERHFPVSERIDLYAGGEFGFGFVSCSGEQTTNSYAEYYDLNDNGKLLGYGTINNVTKFEKQTAYNTTDPTANRDFSVTRFTVAALAGFDFYVYKGLYLGAELGIRFANGKTPKKAYYTENNVTNSTTVANNTTKTTIRDYSSESGISTTTTIEGGVTNTTTAYSGTSLNEGSTTTLKFYVDPCVRLGIKF
jgi:hypothetical protein